jgi:parallel beta-helix repeat protein
LERVCRTGQAIPLFSPLLKVMVGSIQGKAWAVVCSLLGSLALGATASATVTLDPRSLGARTDESQVTALVYVDSTSADASDANPGTSRAPVRTLARAVELAQGYNKQGRGVRVVLQPGIYRESIRVAATGTETPAPMVFEAAIKGTAIISGSDVWSDWRPDGNDGIFSHSWQHAWGLTPYPDGWSCCVVLSDLMRRREMVFANGQRLRQVLTRDELTPGSFLISETARAVYLRLPAGLSIAATTLEVAVRSSLLLVDGRSNIVVRGVTFRHDNSGVGGNAALTVQHSSDVRIEDNVLEWNHNRGLFFTTSRNLTVQRNVINSNGIGGIGGWEVGGSLFADNETSFNNWKGHEAGLTDWDPAGIKLLRLRDTAILGHKSIGNQSYGIWLDTDCVNVLLQTVTATDNLLDGVFLEAVQGPIAVKESLLSRNGRSGILIANAANGSLTANTVTGNHRYQIYVSGAPAGRPVDDHRTGQKYSALQSAHWTMAANIITADHADQALIATTLPAAIWQTFIRSLDSDRNLWFNPASKSALRWVDGVAIDLPTWQNWTRQDQHSCCAAPPPPPANLRVQP